MEQYKLSIFNNELSINSLIYLKVNKNDFFLFSKHNIASKIKWINDSIKKLFEFHPYIKDNTSLSYKENFVNNLLKLIKFFILDVFLYLDGCDIFEWTMYNTK
jgi:hypothetical protein